MAGFNWDDHPIVQPASAPSPDNKKGDSSFNWDDHPIIDPNTIDFNKSEQLSQMSPLKSLGMGAAKGITLGSAPAIAGGLGSIMDVLKGSNPAMNLGHDYVQNALNYNKQDQLAQEAHDVPYTAGEVAGSAIPMIAAPKYGLTPGLEGMAQGAGFGALQSVMGSIGKGEMPTLTSVGSSAAMNGIGGGVLGKLLGYLSPDKLEEIASKRALNSVGTSARDMKVLMDMDRVEDQGTKLVTPNPYTDGPIVQASSPGVEAMYERNKQLLAKSGQKSGEILDELDTHFNPNKLDNNYNPNNTNYVNPQDIINNILEPIKDSFSKNGNKLASKSDSYSSVEKLISDVAQYGDRPVTFSEARQIKDLAQQAAYKDGKLIDPLFGQITGDIVDTIENSIKNVSDDIGKPQLLDEYNQAKDYYTTGKLAEKTLKGSVAKEMTKSDMGLSDWMAYRAGAHTLDPTGLGTLGLKKVLSSVGNSEIASGANQLGNVTRKISDVLSNMKAETLGEWGSQLQTYPSETAKKLGNVLSNASNRDDIGKNALIYTLMDNPAYRDLLKNMFFKQDSVK